MECTMRRDELLEAAPDELAGVAPTALAEHVRSCGSCRDTARVLLAEHARLGNALALVQPRLSADAAVDEALGATGMLPRRPGRREGVQRFIAAFFPMAAAAGLAMYVIYGREDGAPRPLPAPERQITRVRISAPPGTNTVILRTSDPTITFAWIGREVVP